jgi:hypothetical protein
MKRTVAAAVLVALVINCTYSLRPYGSYEEKKPVTISDRVGEEIDAEKREYFELFSGIDNFKSATFYEITGGGLEVRINTQHSKLVAVYGDYRALMILIDYFTRYEDIRQSRQIFEQRWEIIGYDDLGFPITKAELNQVKRGGFAALSPYIGGAAGFVVGFVPGAFLGPAGGVTALIGGAGGFLLGRNIDRNRAFNAIKEARKPRVVY